MASTQSAPNERSSAGWQQVEAALDRLHRLSHTQTVADKFYVAVLTELRGLQLPHAAIWKLTDVGPRLLQRSDSFANLVEHGAAELAHEQAALLEACETLQPRVVRPFSAADSATDPPTASAVCAAAPWSIANGLVGALTAWLPRETPAAGIAGQVRLLGAVAEIVAAFQTQWEWQAAQSQLLVQSRLAPLLLSLHQSLNLNEIAQRIASDGRVATGCDRVAVAILRGRSYRTVAVSGADHLHRHSPTVLQMERLAAAVAAIGEPLWWDSTSPATEQEIAPQVEQRLTEHLDVSPAVALAVLPLRLLAVAPESDDRRPADISPHAVLLFENYTRPFDELSKAVMIGMQVHCATTLAHGLLVRRIPGHWFWLKVTQEGIWQTAAFRWGVAALGLAIMIAALLLIPAEVRVGAAGEIQSAARREIFAPSDGIAVEVFVDHGQLVMPGDKLVSIHSVELDQQLQEARGASDTARKQLAAIQAQRLQAGPGDGQTRQREAALTAEEQQLEAQLKALAEKTKILEQRREELTVRSPLAGEIVTWNARKRLAGRPLRRGDQLLTISDPQGPWQLELRVPSRGAGRVVAAANAVSGGHSVDWTFTSQPDATHRGIVRGMGQRIELDEAGRAHLRLLVEPLAAKGRQGMPHHVTPGSLVTAEISCGQSNLGDAWFHDLIDTVRLWLAF